MTTPSKSNFNARSDQAALSLKQDLSRQLGREIAPRQVQVDDNGQPAPQPPPAGSYARANYDRVMAQRAQHAAQSAEQFPAPQQNEQQVVEQAPQGQRQPEPEQSSNANRRFSELSEALRQKDRDLQAALARSKQLEETSAQAQQRMAAIEAQHQQLIQQNLDAMDPEQRIQVMQDARVRELMAGLESRLESRIAPALAAVQQSSIAMDLQKLSARYPGYDPEVHDVLIDNFRESNPRCSIEQAFKAVATPEELHSGRQPERAPAVPPIAMPQSGGHIPRSIPQQTNGPDPDEEIRDLERRAYELARKGRPEDRPQVNRMLEQVLAKRFPGRLGQGTARRG